MTGEASQRSGWVPYKLKTAGSYKLVTPSMKGAETFAG